METESSEQLTFLEYSSWANVEAVKIIFFQLVQHAKSLKWFEFTRWTCSFYIELESKKSSFNFGSDKISSWVWSGNVLKTILNYLIDIQCHTNASATLQQKIPCLRSEFEFTAFFSPAKTVDSTGIFFIIKF